MWYEVALPGTCDKAIHNVAAQGRECTVPEPTTRQPNANCRHVPQAAEKTVGGGSMGHVEVVAACKAKAEGQMVPEDPHSA